MNPHILSLVFTWLFRAWGLAEFAVVLITRTRRGGGAIRDRGSMFLLWVVITGSLAACFRIGDLHRHTLFGGAAWLLPVALALFIAGLIIRGVAIYTLGRAFSVNVAIRDGQQLQTGGLYSLARHPSYTGMLLIFLGIGTYCRNWIGLAVVVLFPTAALVYRISVEERVLRSAFGEQYVAYSARVKRLIPGIY